MSRCRISSGHWSSKSTAKTLACSWPQAAGVAEQLPSCCKCPATSRTVLEAVAPYCEAAMIDWLGGRPDHFCTPQIARSMALVAFNRARKLNPSEVPLAGIACTAGLASDRPKRGPHRAHVALQPPRGQPPGRSNFRKSVAGGFKKNTW